VSVTQKHSTPPRAGVRGIHHVGITVGDLDRSLAFYRDLLGMRVIGISVESVGEIVGMPGASARIADLDAGRGQLLELIDYGSGPGDASRDPATDASPRDPDTVGSCHVSIEVDDLHGALTRLAAAGHRPMGDVTELSLGGVWEGCRIVYLRDPDAVVIELLQRSREPGDQDGGARTDG
jgi:catechol 2,3-dioxygenase-like lactoylglutathione lyase family enzyme